MGSCGWQRESGGSFSGPDFAFFPVSRNDGDVRRRQTRRPGRLWRRSGFGFRSGAHAGSEEGEEDREKDHSVKESEYDDEEDHLEESHEQVARSEGQADDTQDGGDGALKK